MNRTWQKRERGRRHRTEIYLSRICRDARPLSADAGRTHRLCGGKITGRKTEAPAAFQAQAPSAVSFRVYVLDDEKQIGGLLMKYSPHEYQKYATEYIETHPVAAVLLSMGLGKTSITLTALNDLLFDSFEIHKAIVIAPLRVARDTWPAEIEKWDHLAPDLFRSCGNRGGATGGAETAGRYYIINRETCSGW